MLNHASTVVLCSVNGVLIGHVPCPFLVKTAPSFFPVAVHEAGSQDYFVFSVSVYVCICASSLITCAIITSHTLLPYKLVLISPISFGGPKLGFFCCNPIPIQHRVTLGKSHI